MKILERRSMDAIASLKADEFAAIAGVTDVRLARVYKQAIDYLQKEHEKRPTLPKIKLALEHIKLLRDENVAPGVRFGIEVIDLHNQLTSWFHRPQARKAIAEKIVQIFERASSDYQVMYDLRKTIDADCIGASRLHRLVYQDLDTKSCHQVLRMINQSVKDRVPLSYMVYSDIDDTIKGSLNDKSSHISGFYPGSFEFYNQFKAKGTDDVNITFLSARPQKVQTFLNWRLKKKLPHDTKFFALYGSGSSALSAALYYSVIRALKAIANILPEGALKRKIVAICASRESKTFIFFALEKRRNLDRDLLLRPEKRAVFVGDCGEGDLIFLLMKNCKIPPILTDPKIPEEYVGDKKWDGSFDDPINPTHKPLFLGFAHALTKEQDYGERPDPKYAEDFKTGLQAHIFDNFVDNAITCLKLGVLKREACDTVVTATREWMKKGIGDEVYRQKLARSIEAYDALLPQ